MPNIREYAAPSGKINPDEKGYAAFETAGRRIGPLYNQAAQDVEKGGKLQDQLISQLERETDADTAPITAPRGSGSSRGGGGGGGVASSGGKGGGSSRPAAPDTFVDPIDAGNAAKWAAQTARKLTGAPGGYGSLDELQWAMDNGKELTADQQQRYKMLSDIQTKKDNTRINTAQQQSLEKYIASRDASTAEWYKGLAERQNIGPNDVKDAGAREFNAEVFLGSQNPQLPKDAAKSFDYLTGRSSAAGEALSAGWQNIKDNASFIADNAPQGASLIAGDIADQNSSDVASASEGREDIQ